MQIRVMTVEAVGLVIEQVCAGRNIAVTEIGVTAIGGAANEDPLPARSGADQGD